MSEGGCDKQQQKAALKSLEEAQAFLLSQARAVTERERVAIADALDRVLAESLVSPVDVPPWNNSAMDGYAVRAADLIGARPRLRVTQRIPAGSCGTSLEAGAAARIFTGAPVPPGADTVVIQEVCERQGEEIIINEPPGPGANVRQAGEDIRRGHELLPAGVRLAPQHLGLIASVGIAEISVFRRLKVALFSSGDELVAPGGELAPGQIYNSNQFTLGGLVRRLGCEVIDLGRVADNLEATCEALARGAEQADLVLASGGVSVGEEDHVKPAVERLGSLDLWKIAIRPGKPLAFGHIGATPFIGAPGNPVSLFVTFLLFARPFILKSQGVDAGVLPLPFSVRAGFDWPQPNQRREFARARLEVNQQGERVAALYPSRSSGVLSSVVWANGLVEIPEQRTISKGESVNFLPFCELLS